MRSKPVNFFAFLAARLPWRFVRAVALSVAWLLTHLVRVRRRETLSRIASCFPDATPAWCRSVYAGMWKNLCLSTAEVLRYIGGRRTEALDRMELRGAENARAAMTANPDTGAFALISHLGNYPLLAVNVPPLVGYPLSFVTKRFSRPGANRLWEDLQALAGIEGIYAQNAYRPCVRAVRSHRVLGFMLDQNRPAEQGVFVPFFGRPASTSPGLALMSWQTKAPVAPVFAHREPDGHHVVEILPPIPPPPDRKPETILAFTARYTAEIEAAVRRHPDQWLWLHRRWKSQPPPASDSASP